MASASLPGPSAECSEALVADFASAAPAEAAPGKRGRRGSQVERPRPHRLDPPGLAERQPQALLEAPDQTRVAKPDFRLLRVHVDVDVVRVEGQLEKQLRQVVAPPGLANRAAEGGRHGSIADHTTIDQHHGRPAADRHRAADPAQPFASAGDGREVLSELLPEDLTDPVAQRRCVPGPLH